MATPSIARSDVVRALRAPEAGEVLAKLIGLPDPIPATKMWRLARLNILPKLRIGRQYYFRTVELEEFVATGGCGYTAAREIL